MIRALGLALAPAVLCAACAIVRDNPQTLAISRGASDVDTYELRRVGLVPFRGAGVDPAAATELQRAFHFELTQAAEFEIILLTSSDVAEAVTSDPHRLGYNSPATVLELCRRFRLDGLLVGTVTELDAYAPQALAVQVELVARETGLAIWWSRVQLDAADGRLRDCLEVFESRRDSGPGPVGAELTLLSPSRLARFAAYEIARTL